MAQSIIIALAFVLFGFAFWAANSRSLAAIRLRARFSLQGMDPCKEAAKILMDGDLKGWGIHGVEEDPDGFRMTVFLPGGAWTRSQASMQRFFLGYGQLSRSKEDPRYVDCFIARRRVEQFAGRQTTAAGKSPEIQTCLACGATNTGSHLWDSCLACGSIKGLYPQEEVLMPPQGYVRHTIVSEYYGDFGEGKDMEVHFAVPVSEELPPLQLRHGDRADSGWRENLQMDLEKHPEWSAPLSRMLVWEDETWVPLREALAILS